ncbi:glycosyltransferase [Vibrio astriarenae]|uniref:Glycosyltransferase n=1 Tax=Vibrio astriarenae TaxID=1481923 RepID=A0A7Z2YEI1_9VIBR|nr:glycosyltransferase [Vibrio astriarenae]QIA64458.1 glycosyltransferase [Vibrio astriarenae]
MSLWLKSKLGRVMNAHRTEPENDVGTAEVETTVEPQSSILQCLDLCGVYQDHLVVRGWCVDGDSPIKVSVSSAEGYSAPLIAEKSEARTDVAEHLGLQEHSLDLGFSHVYDIADLPDDLVINLSSEISSLTLPLQLAQSPMIEVRTEWESFGLEEDNTPEPVVELVAVEETVLQEQEQEQEQEPQDEVAELPEPEPEIVEPYNPIRHNIEVAGIYKNKLAMIRGWCADIDSGDKVWVSAKQDAIPVRVVKYIKRERPDVADCFGLSSSSSDYGFLMLIDLTYTFNGEIELELACGEHQSIVSLNELTPLTKDDVEHNLADGDAMSLIDTKRFLLEVLGETYFADLQTDMVETSEVTTNIHVESGFALEHGCFIRGWIDDHSGDLLSLHITDGRILSEDILPSMVRKVRPDVNDAFLHLPVNFKAGFFCYTELKGYSNPLFAVLFDKSGKVAKLPLSLNSIDEDEVVATQHMLTEVDPHSKDLPKVYEKHIGPALLSLWKERTRLPSIESTTVYNFGKQPDSPLCSLIVPLYGRYDFVLHQISQFDNDPDFKNVELIYVIDDPRIEQATKALCEDVSQLYCVPFKLVTCGRNLGFAGANNLGVRYANSEHLLLLNSDVLPSEQGWLSRMVEQYQRTENIGALGVKLVFEDESIQHIGMNFNKSPEYGDLWLNEHPYKGMPEYLAPKFELKKVPTVTAACLLVETAKYREIGGFETQYILGDFEDSDLCLKLLESGYDNYILGTEKLYHLERLSQSLVDQGDWKFKLTLFNGWQHTQRWNPLITSLQA